jgi:hypothetical protein
MSANVSYVSMGDGLFYATAKNGGKVVQDPSLVFMK